MNNYKRFIKNTKAISPIFATLILIAIAVIAGVVVYMFTSGFLSSSTGNTQAAQDRLAVSGASYDGIEVSVYIQNTATDSSSVTVSGLLVKDSSGATIDSVSASGLTSDNVATDLVVLQADGLVTITGAATIPDSGTYTVTVTTAGGGSFPSPAFTFTAP